MKRALEIAAGLLIAGATLWGVGVALAESRATFLEYCTSRDVLQPDGNIRMTEALDRYQDLRDGRYLRFVRSFFTGDTWPPLRPTLALALFLVFQPDAVLDASVSLVFYALLFPSLAFIAVRMSRSWIGGAGLFAFIAALLVHAREFAAYANASMLETQGMFFLVWTIYFLAEMLRECYAERAPSADESDRRVSRPVFAGLLASFLGLTFTKYPYVIMLFLALAAYEALRDPRGLTRLVTTLLDQHYRGWRRAALAVVALAFVSILVAGKLGYAGLNSKSVKYGIWFFSAVIFVDLAVFAFRRRALALSAAPAALRYIYLCGILPAFAWILSHPDRFSSIIGGQFWLPPAGMDVSLLFRKTFFETLFLHVFIPPALFAGLLAAGGAALIALAYFAGRATRAPQSGAPLAADGTRPVARLVQRLEPVFRFVEGPLAGFRLPAFFALAIVWLQFFAQELFSPNKQDRHIYHLLPALGLYSGLALMAALAAAPPHFRRVASAARPAGMAVSLAGLACLGCAVFSAVRSGGVFSAGYSDFRVREFCFTGRAPELFEPARWAAAQLAADRRTVLINAMNTAPFELNQREQTTELDLLLRMRAIAAGGAVRNDNRHVWKSWSEFDRLVTLTPTCPDAAGRAQIGARAAALGVRLGEPLRELPHPGGRLCLLEYSLSAADAAP